MTKTKAREPTAIAIEHFPQPNLTKLRALDCFSGIGGLALGLKDYCHTVAYCEFDKNCQQFLLNRMATNDLDNAPIWDDIRTLNQTVLAAAGIGPIDIIVGGFPCQDASNAGARRGLDGERTGLFFELMRLADETKAEWLFFENVQGLLTRNFERVTFEFSQRGYALRWIRISAGSLGAPHERERVFLLAHSNRKSEPDSEERKVYPSKTSKMGERIEELQRLFDRNNISRIWEKGEPELVSLDDGIPKGLVKEVKAYGNAVVPIQAKVAFECLVGLNLSWLPKKPGPDDLKVPPRGGAAIFKDKTGVVTGFTEVDLGNYIDDDETRYWLGD